MRVTAIVLEPHIIGPLQQAAAQVNAHLDLFFIHAYDSTKLSASLAKADVVLGGMLNLDGPTQALAQLLQANRPTTALFFHSQVELLSVTRIGDFDAKTDHWRDALQVLRAAGAPLPGLLNIFMAALPQVASLLPEQQFSGMQRYAQASRLWQEGTPESLAALFGLLKGQRPGTVQLMPHCALWHPEGGLFADLDSYRAWYRRTGPAVGVILHRRWIASGSTEQFTQVITRLEARGLSVYAGFSDLDATPLVERFFAPAGVDVLLNLISFNLIGGHGRPDPRRAARLLERFDRPYLCAVPLIMQSLAQWQASRIGLPPQQSVMQVVMPELEGGAEPWVYGDSDSLLNRIVARTERWVLLRRAPVAERRIAITIFSMPPDKGSVGTAAYLDVFASLFRLMVKMQEAGYTVHVPESVEALRHMVLGADTALPGAESITLADRLDVKQYKRFVPQWPRIAKCWGAPPGLIDTDGRSLAIRGRRFGNLFVGIQPGFGYEGDPMRLLFHPNASPSHSFAAYYAWLDRVFQAHAVLHFGTHGALEFMPGKQVGLGGDDFSALLLGEMPHLYYYSVNNPAEASLAKRRGGAVTISYLTPPLAEAGLYRQLLAVRDALRAYQERPTDAALEVVVELSEAADLGDDVPSGPDWVERLADYLVELETRLIPVGLHVAGESTGLEETARLAARLHGEPARADAVMQGAAASDELGALVRALDGRFIPPAPGGDPARSPEVLPTGRNIHAINPWSMPSPVAARVGRAQAEAMLAKYGRMPESVAMVLWGTDNIKTQGEMVAQALWLMGAEAYADSLGRMSRVRLVPLERLGRPRIDVVMTCSGIFRDLFPSVLELLDQAVLLAAQADEPLEQNFVRKRTLALSAELNLPVSSAARRIFCTSSGQYGTGVNHLVQDSAWTSEGELGRTYLERMSYAYGRGQEPAKEGALLRSALKSVEVTVQQVDSTEISLADVDHYFEHLGGLVAATTLVRGARPEAIVLDAAAAGAKPRHLQEALRIESRTRLLNPRWYEGMLAHGYQGVHEIAQRLDHTFGWQATTGAVDRWVFNGATAVLKEQGERMSALNPQAVVRMAGRLLEAHQRGLWAASAEDVEYLDRLQGQADSLAEGVSS